MAELNLIQLNNEKRLQILRKLGYDIDEQGFIIKIETKKGVICEYGGEKVHINTVAILPGSLKIINANPLTMAEYFMDIDNQNE